MLPRFKLLILSLSSAILLSIAWYWHLSILIFFAFVPLLILEDLLTSKKDPSKLKLFGYVYLSFLIWNSLVTWWIYFASFGGACMAIIANSLLMSIVFILFSYIKNKISKIWGTWLLVPIWVAWEHGHTLWDLSWSWLNIGNVFAFNHHWIQWYEYTGASGGTIWALAVNILIFNTLKLNRVTKIMSMPIFKIAISILLPILLSYIILLARKPLKLNKENLTNVIIIQPNIDPYNVKFTLDYQSQFFKTLDLLKNKITNKTDYLVLPETFITDNLNEININQSIPIKWFRDSLISKFPKLKIITGGNSYVFYDNQNEISSTARLDKESGKYYDVFNSGFFIDSLQVKVYHKSKLVPGVERMPFPTLLKPLESLAINLGGTMGSIGTQEARSVFNDSLNKVCIAPIICYESIYADYVTEFIRLGANLIFIITNDGWWQDTPGYIQHLNFARLRAIENRRQIARSANTGTSCFIDEFGNIEQTTPWWKEAIISKSMSKNLELTFFSRYGDLLSYCSVLTCLILILYLLFIKLKSTFFLK